MQFENSYSAMDTINKKGFNLMDQVKPRLILPTHVGEASVKMLGERWPSLYSDKLLVAIAPSELTSDTRVLFLGATSTALAEITNATKVDW